MGITYFISDIHIRSARDPKAKKFIGAVDSLTLDKCERLILLGDIFDMWVGRHEFFVKEYALVVAAVANLVQRGVEVLYFEGNHDLYLDLYWQQEVGVEVIKNPIVLDLYGKQVRMEHGDLANPNDRGYLFLKWVLQTPAMHFLANRMPSRLARAIGERASRASRDYTDGFDIDSRDVIHSYAHSLAEGGEDFDILVTGHLHVQDEYEFVCNDKTRISINLGWWANGAKWLKFGPDGFAFEAI